MNYSTVTKGGDSLVEVKRSKFIGIIRAVSSVSEAEALIQGERKKYHDAKHHCSAYIIRGIDGAPDIIHSSDDGEPSGTAGAPILEVLTGAGLKDVCLVVTRYFGGTLLGTGGLVRAYTDAAKAALSDSVISEMTLMQQFGIIFDYTFTGSIDHFLSNKGITKLDAIYTDKVEYKLACPEASFEEIKKSLTDMTSSVITINKENLVYTPVG
ncbi:MAG: YigZ family protein [Lachnospiraceae bacterium]|nr:YigZ family protein [Lachnospiraceae bacterium]